MCVGQRPIGAPPVRAPYRSQCRRGHPRTQPRDLPPRWRDQRQGGDNCCRTLHRSRAREFHPCERLGANSGCIRMQCPVRSSSHHRNSRREPITLSQRSENGSRPFAQERKGLPRVCRHRRSGQPKPTNQFSVPMARLLDCVSRTRLYRCPRWKTRDSSPTRTVIRDSAEAPGGK